MQSRISIALFALLASACGGAAVTAAPTHVAGPSPARAPDAARDRVDGASATGDPTEVDPAEVHSDEGDREDASGEAAPRGADPRLARQAAIERASQAGILGLLGGGDAPEIDLDEAMASNGVTGGMLGVGSVGSMGLGGGTVSGLGGLGGGSPGPGAIRIADRRRGAPEETVARVRAPSKPLGPPTRTWIASITATGIATDAVSSAFDRSDRSLRECYEALLVRVPDASGTLEIEIEIGRNGRVASGAKIGGTPRDPELAKCVTAVTRDLVLPAGGDAKAVVSLGLARAPS